MYKHLQEDDVCLPPSKIIKEFLVFNSFKEKMTKTKNKINNNENQNKCGE